MPRSSLPFTLPADATASGEEKVIGQKCIKVNTIRDKWDGHNFIRHINGNTLDNRAINLGLIGFVIWKMRRLSL